MNDANEPNIGQNIRKYRILRGFERKEFAAMIKVAPGTLSKYESNNPIPDMIRLRIIASVLLVSIPQLMVDPVSLLPHA